MKIVEPMMWESNFEAFLSDAAGKIIEGSRRVGHNVVTTTGKNWLSKLVAWDDISSSPDDPFTQRRVRWMGVGKGSQLEVATVAALVDAVPYSAGGDYLAPMTSVEFPTSASVKFTRIFAAAEITTTPTPVAVTEAGLFADVDPWNMGGTEDTQAIGFPTTLAPNIGSNPPVAYKSFEPITKTQDFSLTIRWELRF